MGNSFWFCNYKKWHARFRMSARPHIYYMSLCSLPMATLDTVPATRLHAGTALVYTVQAGLLTSSLYEHTDAMWHGARRVIGGDNHVVAYHGSRGRHCVYDKTYPTASTSTKPFKPNNIYCNITMPRIAAFFM